MKIFITSKWQQYKNRLTKLQVYQYVHCLKQIIIPAIMAILLCVISLFVFPIELVKHLCFTLHVFFPLMLDKQFSSFQGYFHCVKSVQLRISYRMSYFVSLHIQSECGKIRTRKNSLFGHFSRSVYCSRFYTSHNIIIYL